MIAIRPVGDMIRPVLLCVICHTPMRLADSWIAFEPLAYGVKEREGRFVHKRCADGHVETLTGGDQVTLWRASDLFMRLLRD